MTTKHANPTTVIMAKVPLARRIEFIMNTNGHFDISQLWIGLAHVKPKPGNSILGNAIGAYAHVACAADTRDEFVNLVQRFLDERDFELCEVEDVEPLRAVIDRQAVHEDFMAEIRAVAPYSLAIDTMQSQAGTEVYCYS